MSYKVEDPDRNVAIDFCRCIACIAVVIIHVLAPYWYSTPVLLTSIDEYKVGGVILIAGTYGWRVCSVIDALSRFSVPLFVVISGALMLNKKILYQGYIVRKVLHLISMVFFWGLVYAVFGVFLDLLSGRPIEWIAKAEMFFLGPGVFWFIFMLIPLYITSPILKHILNERGLSRLYIVLWFFLTLIFDSVKVWIPQLSRIAHFSYIGLFPIYSGYFMIGGYFEKYGIKRKYENILIGMGCLSLVVMLIGKPEGYFHNFTTPFAAIYTMAIMVVAHRIDWNKIDPNINNMIMVFSKYTMGIYALHILMLNILTAILQNNDKMWALQILFLVFVSILASLGITIVIKKIPLIRKIV